MESLPGQNEVARAIPALAELIAQQSPRIQNQLRGIANLVDWWANTTPEQIAADISAWHKTGQAARGEDVIELQGKVHGVGGIKT